MLFIFLALLHIYFRLFVFQLNPDHLFHWRIATLGILNDIVIAAIISLFFQAIWLVVRPKLIRCFIFLIFIILWSLINFSNYEYIISYNTLLPLDWFNEVINYTTTEVGSVFSILDKFINWSFFGIVVVPIFVTFLWLRYFPLALQFKKIRIYFLVFFFGVACQSATLDPGIQPLWRAPMQNHLFKYWYYDYDETVHKEQKIALTEFSDAFQKFVIDKENPKKRILPRSVIEQPNILLFQLEQFRAFELGALGSQLGLSPNFDRYAKQGTLFTNIYSMGHLTKNAQFGVLCGGLSQRFGYAFTRFPDHVLRCMPDYLKENGYDTWWFHGQSAAYDYQGYFMKKHHVDHIMARLSFPRDAETLGWGISDMELVKFSLKHLDQMQEPFFVYLQTQTNHAPYEAPPEYLKERVKKATLNKYYSTFKYTDDVFGYFMDKFLQTEKGKNTVIVIYGDHGNGMDLVEKERIDKFSTLQKYQVPILIIYPEREREGKPKTMPTVGGLYDIFPTVLDLVGIPIDFPVLAKSLARNYQHQYAKGIIEGNWLTYNNRFYLEGKNQVFSVEGKPLPISSQDKVWLELIKEIEHVQLWMLKQSDANELKHKMMSLGWNRF